MKLEVTFLTQRGTAVMRRARHVDAPEVRFGRGTDNDVQLADIRVDLSAAVLSKPDGGLTIAAAGPSPLRVNGRSTSSAPVGPGDEVLIGPYRLKFTEPATGDDAALSVELAQPLGDALARVMSQAQLRLDSSAFSKRALAWAGFLLIGLLCLAAPIIGYSAGSARIQRSAPATPDAGDTFAALWEPSGLSNAHRFFAANCAACHQSAFAVTSGVPDKACLTCHSDTGNHVAASGPDTGLRHAVATMRCTQCHEEHRGSRGTVIADDRLCQKCHFTPAETGTAAGRHDVPGFSSAHPQFLVTLVADPSGPHFKQVRLGSAPPPRDNPGLKFSHKAHLETIGKASLGDRQVKGCADCHTAEPSRQGFMPITYEQKCQRCHQLTFAPQDLPWPNATVPHGKGAGIAAAVWNYYAGKVLQGRMEEAAAPAVVRQAPGVPSNSSPSGSTPTAWVAAKTEAALRNIVFEDKRGCAYCHNGTGPKGSFDLSSVLPVTAKPPRPDAGPIVIPVVMRTRFMPRAAFDHSRHASVPCERCHDARQANASGTVMVPKIETCLSCHGPDNASRHVESTCITCHLFHHDAFGPMRPTAVAKQQ